MASSEDKLRAQAKQWVKVNRKKLIAEFCNQDQFPKTDNPVTIFMAGSPGAGKTELSQSLSDEFGGGFVRIDADEIREKMRAIGYNGKNSDIFQDAANKAVNLLFDYANKKGGQNVILDGTFAYGNWRENVERSIAHERTVDIYYLYQDPTRAWDFVQRRASKDGGRYVPKAVFMQAYIEAIKNVRKAKQLFGNKITVYFAKNNYQKNIEKIVVDVDDIDKYLPKMYTLEELEARLDERKDT